MIEPQPAAAATGGVRIRGLRKRYGDTIALDGLDLDAYPGQILGVAGPNGAGKSTMVKILAAETVVDDGEIIVDDAPWSVDIGAHRVAVVHQEPQLFPNLTVGENVMVGREGTRWLRRDLRTQELTVMHDLGIDAVRDRLLEDVPLAVQQRTEIARALVQDARVFLFDEPNSALTEEESNDLFRRMHALADAGRVVILVSHRLAELVRHCDRVVVVLDGRTALTLEGEALTQEAIARELVVVTATGEDRVRAAHSAGATETPVVELHGWSHRGGEFADVELTVRAGRIVAFVGVEGSGARELVRSIAGFEPGHGTLLVQGRSTPGGVAAASGFVSADRGASLFGNMSVGDNVVSRLDAEITGAIGSLRRGRMRSIAADIRASFRVKSPSLGTPIRSLSGGNQQKVAIAAAVVRRPAALVLEEPTRGVDIGSKEEIYRLLRDYAADGHAVILYCTEVPEVFDVADRVYVVSDGRVSEPLDVAVHEDVKALAAAITRRERHQVPQTVA
ncbi:MAG: sugar ABC transporter ATP-binding protein [Chloroflexi bacterium]|nr:sugar ABC transporter ATP-binding protein [Chloroflexota bacterium]